MNIAVFASHGGSDLQAIIDGCKNNQINARVSVVISNNGNSMALQRAEAEGIPVILPLINDIDILLDQLSACDGLLLPGGID
ncbi:MAG: formyltransferase family protein, partial [Eubacterium sp.]|nr:formyltransferase family protein [Eubacterium sp.]